MIILPPSDYLHRLYGVVGRNQSPPSFLFYSFVSSSLGNGRWIAFLPLVCTKTKSGVTDISPHLFILISLELGFTLLLFLYRRRFCLELLFSTRDWYCNKKGYARGG